MFLFHPHRRDRSYVEERSEELMTATIDFFEKKRLERIKEDDHAAVGPNYCPLDGTIYVDETFFDEMRSRFGAQAGDVAEAHVIAHVVGNHVQKRIGVMDEIRYAQLASGSQQEANELSVSMELQTDCVAGVWANSIRDADVFFPARSRRRSTRWLPLAMTEFRNGSRGRSCLNVGRTALPTSG